MPSYLSESGNLLVLRLSSFGDVVLAEPVVRAVKETYPNSRVWFLTYDQYKAIPSLFSPVDSVIPYSKEQGTGQLLDEIGSIDFDVIVDLQNSLRSIRIVRRLKTRKVLKYRRQYFRRFFSVHLPWVWKNSLKHTVELYFDALRPLGIATGDLFPKISAPEPLACDLTLGLGNGPVIAVCPGGSSPVKRWSEDSFAEVVRRLLSLGHTVALVGSETDRAVTESVVEKVDDETCLTYVGNDVKKMASLLSRCAITITNDSGLMHLAAAVGSCVVAIFGPTAPLLGFAPLSRRSIVVTRGLACSPCSYHGNKPCKYKERLCMDTIVPDEVTGIVDDLVSENFQSRRKERS